MSANVARADFTGRNSDRVVEGPAEGSDETTSEGSTMGSLYMKGELW